MKVIKLTFLFFLGVFLLNSCQKVTENEQHQIKRTIHKHRIVYINSYDLKIKWCRDIKNAMLEKFNITENFDGTLDNSESDVELKILNMDTKNHSEESYIKKISLRIKNIIDDYNPEVIVASDDNAVKYVISKYYKNSDIPVVFAGVNWDVSGYGLPVCNVTGQIEIEDVKQLIDQVKKYKNVNTIGVLTGDTYTDHKTVESYKKSFNENFSRVEFVDNLKDWKNNFLEMQNEVDFLILRNKHGIKDWNNDIVRDFVNENTNIHTGTFDLVMKDFVLFSFIKVPREMGQYLADTALNIINGRNISDIPVSKNIQVEKYINPKIAERLKLKFSMDDIENSHFTEDKKKKVLYLNSYFESHKWALEELDGMLKRFHIIKDKNGNFDTSLSDVLFKKIDLDIHVGISNEQINKIVFNALKVINEYKPDIIIAGDDYASKYIVKPHLKDKDIPVVFCGINWDVSDYGFPYKNVTGMIEKTPIVDLINYLKKYTKGERIGILSYDGFTQRKEVKNFIDKMNLKLKKTIFVKNFKEWKENYVEIQKDVDILVLISNLGIRDWNEKEAKELVQNNTRIITGSPLDFMANLVFLCVSKQGEEHGWYAASTALKILRGKNISKLKITDSKNYQIILNRDMFNRFGKDISLIENENKNTKSINRKKVFYVNSYNEGYLWSDKLFNGLLKYLNINRDIISNDLDMDYSKVDFEFAYMDSKRRPDENYLKNISKIISRKIEKFNPDVVITSDDNALKYVGLEYVKNMNIPIVFCGVNAGAEKYGLPIENITGLFERSDFSILVDLMKKYSRGKRLGALISTTVTSQIELNRLKENSGVIFHKEYMVNNKEKWKKAFLDLQKEVDMIYLFGIEGLKNWNNSEIKEFVYKNVEVVVGCTLESLMDYSTFGIVKIPEEHGLKAGEYAMKIIDGSPVSSIPIGENVMMKKYINMSIMKKIGVKAYSEDIKNMEIYE